jgi:hypothetical protein
MDSINTREALTFPAWPFSKSPLIRYQLLVILISCSPIPVKAQSSNIYESLDNP